MNKCFGDSSNSGIGVGPQRGLARRIRPNVFASRRTAHASGFFTLSQLLDQPAE